LVSWFIRPGLAPGAGCGHAPACAGGSAGKTAGL